VGGGGRLVPYMALAYMWGQAAGQSMVFLASVSRVYNFYDKLS